jgi:amidase
MNRREFLQTTAVGVAPMMAASSALHGATPPRPSAAPFRLKSFEWEEATVAQLQAAMKSGKETAASLAEKYLRRIEQVDRGGPAINAIIELNPDAPAIARELDKERKARGPRGPLH